MTIPLVVILGLACTFYIYVAIRWWSAAMTAKQEGRRASAVVRLFDGAEHDMGSAPFRDVRENRASSGIRQVGYENRSVIVMNRARLGK
jgi:hypothetical protein